MRNHRLQSRSSLFLDSKSEIALEFSMVADTQKSRDDVTGNVALAKRECIAREHPPISPAVCLV